MLIFFQIFKHGVLPKNRCLYFTISEANDNMNLERCFQLYQLSLVSFDFPSSFVVISTFQSLYNTLHPVRSCTTVPLILNT